MSWITSPLPRRPSDSCTGGTNHINHLWIQSRLLPSDPGRGCALKEYAGWSLRVHVRAPFEERTLQLIRGLGAQALGWG